MHNLSILTPLLIDLNLDVPQGIVLLPLLLCPLRSTFLLPLRRLQHLRVPQGIDDGREGGEFGGGGGGEVGG